MNARLIFMEQSIRQVCAAHAVARDLARQLSDDARRIAALRAAVIAAMEDARRRKVVNFDRLALTASVAENVSPANASAFVPALVEFSWAAETFAAALQEAAISAASFSCAEEESAQKRLSEFATEFDKTCELAKQAARDNKSVIQALTSALAVFESA